MREELTQAELDAIFYGKPPTVTAKFHRKEILDKPASIEAGRRVNKQVVYVTLACEKEDTQIDRLARPIDFHRYPDEYAAFVKESEHEDQRTVPDLRPAGIVGG